MKMRAWVLALFVLAIGLTACSESRERVGSAEDTEAPTVSAIFPSDGANDLALLQPFTITFSEPMDTTTFNAQTISIEPATVAADLRPAATGDFLTVLPDSFWPPLQTMDLTLAGATDLAGNALAAHSISVETGPLDCAHFSDPFEPNDDLAAARPLALDSLYSRLTICDDDEDFFSVTVGDTLKLTAQTALASGSNVSWMIYWWDATRGTYATLGTSAEAGFTETFHYTFLPGIYHLQLWEYDGDQKVVYDLKIETSEPCDDDPFEDNDFYGDAKPIASGLHQGLRGCYLDADWYALPVLAGQTITVTVDTGDYTYLRRMGIHGPGGAAVEETTHGDAVSSVSVAMTGSGNAGVSMQVWEDDVTYDMTITVGE
ncbi:MAG: Ig-like domain-containing protein [Candidatus Eisenbacteria bacterium]